MTVWAKTYGLTANKVKPFHSVQRFNELDEARFIVGRIREWKRQGGKLIEAAVLYRNNAQSRVLEEALIQDGINYRIYGGLRFYERQEIKDALAYLRLINNRQDDAALERIINTPTRGIGDTSMDKVRELPAAEQANLMAKSATNGVPARADRPRRQCGECLYGAHQQTR